MKYFYTSFGLNIFNHLTVLYFVLINLFETPIWIFKILWILIIFSTPTTNLDTFNLNIKTGINSML